MSENDPMMDESVAYQRGRNACRAGYKVEDNPYWATENTHLAMIWLNGWGDQEAEELLTEADLEMLDIK